MSTVNPAIAEPGLTPAVRPVPALDVSGHPRVPFGRLLRVEFRKMLDTRAGFWLLVGTAALVAVVLVIMTWVALVNDETTLSYTDYLAGVNFPLSAILPVLAILSVTQEWGQRTHLVTFTLEPSRLRVVAAKAVAVLGLAVAIMVVSLAVAALANLAYGAMSGDGATWGIQWMNLAGWSLNNVIGMAFAFALGALLLNSAFAIVMYFAYWMILSQIIAVGSMLLDWFADIAEWLDLQTAIMPMVETADSMSGQDWAQVGTACLLWIVLPLLIGLRRIRRSELK
ncbi:MAG: ABC transporter permease [Micrococcales bacterium]|nr:MAG: ABC transporter permease [Micrococcales bacterium]